MTALTLTFGLAACGEKAPPTDAAAAHATKLVKTMIVGDVDAANEQRYSGEVRARYETPLGFRVGGKIVERLADAGAHVGAGQALARLDPADARLAAGQAESARALAAADLRRSRDLRGQNFISQAALDAKESAAAAAEAQAGLAKNQAAYTTLTADAAGVIAAVLAEPGQVVGAGQAVFRLARDGEREVAIAIPESRVARHKVGDAAVVTLWATGVTAPDGNAGKTYRGRLRELSPAADAASRTFAARISILDADAAVALGMTARVAFAGPAEPGIRVPLAALLQKGEAGSVWVVGKDHRVTQRPVVIERFTEAGAIVTSGLTPGEMIVAAGAFKLTAGETVRLAEDVRK